MHGSFHKLDTRPPTVVRLSPLRLEPVYGLLLYIDKLSSDPHHLPTVVEDRLASRHLVELDIPHNDHELAALILYFTNPLYKKSRTLEVWRAIARVIARMIQNHGESNGRK